MCLAVVAHEFQDSQGLHTVRCCLKLTRGAGEESPSRVFPAVWVLLVLDVVKLTTKISRHSQCAGTFAIPALEMETGSSLGSLASQSNLIGELQGNVRTDSVPEDGN